MKKIVKCLLMMMIVICLCACGKKGTSGSDPIIRDWKLDYFVMGEEKTLGIGVAAEPHIEFTETDMTFTNNRKPRKGSWKRLEDGTYEIALEGVKNGNASATINGDILTFTLHGQSKDIVFEFSAKN